MRVRSPFDFRDKSFTKTEFECGVKKVENDRFFRCTLEDCQLDLVEPSWTRLYECSLRGCIITAREDYREHWKNCRWVDCGFIGDYASAGFGGRDEECELPAGLMVVDCDFRQANLDGCVLLNADVKSVRFPVWPNITILEPNRHKSELRSLSFPSDMQIWWEGYISGAHPTYSSMTFHWERVVERTKSREYVPRDFTSFTAILRSSLSQFPYIVM